MSSTDNNAPVNDNNSNNSNNNNSVEQTESNNSNEQQQQQQPPPPPPQQQQQQPPQQQQQPPPQQQQQQQQQTTEECSVMEDDTGNLKELVNPEFKVIGSGELWGKLISLNPNFQSIEIRQNSIQMGRSAAANNDIIFTSPTVSGKHCKIYRDPSVKTSNVVFVDDFSTNGTYINGGVMGKGSKILIESGCEISIIPKKGTEKISYIYQDCFEEQRELEEGGPQMKYNLRDVLGTGNFATVRLGVEKESGNKYAIKIIDKKKMSMTSKRKDSLMDEVNVLSKVNHQNIISIKEVFETHKNLYLVLELVTGGELFDRIVEEKKFSEDTCRYILKQLCDAVRYLHSNGIAHRDLKPENILMAKADSYLLKISDFGLSRALDEGTYMKTMCGTPQYVAPEILTKGEREGYGKSVDIWSIGVILYILLCGFAPFGDPQGKDFFEKIKAGGFSFPSPYWDSISDEVKDLIKNLIKVDVEKRFTIDQTLNHSWFTNHEENTKQFYDKDSLLYPKPPINDDQQPIQLNSNSNNNSQLVPEGKQFNEQINNQKDINNNNNNNNNNSNNSSNNNNSNNNKKRQLSESNNSDSENDKEDQEKKKLKL